jgi:hypothetical protein
MDGLARDLGHPGPPVGWSRARRREAENRLDRLYERLYRLTPAQSALIAEDFDGRT